ncbi:MAG TPA: hypothetical protein VE593_07915 [Nitrososphaeraceae archaeon]|nr:hypothetical protein [Nitrososphaeraceae archaeon]
MQMFEENKNDNNTTKIPKIKHNIILQTINIVLMIITSALVISAIPSQLLVSDSNNIAFAANSNEQPNINAANLFNTKTIVLPNNVKNLVILVPDEAHHSPKALPAKRFINQTYLPQNAVVSPGTTIVWFSGDNAHDHFINLNDAKNNALIFSSGAFAFNTATKPVKLNNTGDFIYSDPENAKSREVGVNGYVMTGTIRVINQPSSSNSGGITAATTTATTNSTAAKFDTVGTLMVPAKRVSQYISEFKSHGLEVNSTQQFKALRNGSQQVLLVWTSNGLDLNKILTALNQITATLPYT